MLSINTRFFSQKTVLAFFVVVIGFFAVCSYAATLAG
jgi:hypothetical protein